MICVVEIDHPHGSVYIMDQIGSADKSGMDWYVFYISGAESFIYVHDH